MKKGYWAVQDLNKNPQSKSNKGLTENTTSHTVHNTVHILKKFPELAALIKRWETLPEATQREIVRLAGTSAPESQKP